jgi:hypothetical protein
MFAKNIVAPLTLGTKGHLASLNSRHLENYHEACPRLSPDAVASSGDGSRTNQLAQVCRPRNGRCRGPNAIFIEDAGKPEKGYGRRFLTPDGRANLTVQSVPNDAGDSPAAFLASKNPPSNIVYQRIAPRFFVVSGFRNENIWYNRCNLAGRYINCVPINYPAAEKRKWDSVVTRISNTLAAR